MPDGFRESLTNLQEQNRLRRLTPRRQEGIFLIEADGTRLANFGSNDYLGLAQVVGSAGRDGAGATASGLVCGWTDEHQKLAEEIADFEQTESAVVFPSGYAACMGTIAALGRAGDLLLSDQLNHASLIDGCRLSKADKIVYPHRDMDALASILQQRRDSFRDVWIVTDSVFSMDGHVAPLAEIVDLAERFNAKVVTDEAHATGVIGKQGRGVSEALGVSDRVAVRIGTLSKGLGSQGGFVCGSQVLIDFLVNHCRPLMFSTALSIPAVLAAREAFRRVRLQPERRERVRGLARTLRSALDQRAADLESDVPIVPLVVGRDEDAVAASERLARQGFYVPAIRPPTVPDGTARLRISLSADHDDDLLRSLIEGLRFLRCPTTLSDSLDSPRA